LVGPVRHMEDLRVQARRSLRGRLAC
jgi:hypothetical protein